MLVVNYFAALAVYCDTFLQTQKSTYIHILDSVCKMGVPSETVDRLCKE